MNGEAAILAMQIEWLSQLEPWEVPLLVMAIIVTPISVKWLVSWLHTTTSTPDPDTGHRDQTKAWQLPNITAATWGRVQTVALALLTALILIFFTRVLGPTGADKVATVASAVSAMVGVFLTFQSFLNQPSKKGQEHQQTKKSHPANTDTTE